MPPVTNAQIAPTAKVHRDAKIGPGVVIGDFCVIEEDVVLGSGCVLEPYVYIKRWTTLGKRNHISAGTVLGTDPLDKGFKGDRSYLKIGNGNQIREHYTISRGTAPESETIIGDENYIMTSGHIAHNCTIGNQTVIASGALIAGYVDVEDQAFISGNVVVHQYSQDRAPGDDRRRNARESGCAAVFSVLGLQREAHRPEPGGPAARRLRLRRNRGAEGGVQSLVPLRVEAGRRAQEHRAWRLDRAHAAPGSRSFAPARAASHANNRAIPAINRFKHHHLHVCCRRARVRLWV